MSEFEEFADALIDQISVELKEEQDIATLSDKISQDAEFNVKFDSPYDVASKIRAEIQGKLEEFTGISVPADVKIEFPGLEELKKIKGKKVFVAQQSRKFVDDLFEALSMLDRAKIANLVAQDTAKFLVYSTYAKSYISKISTTYGDYLDGVIYINNFVLSSYPQIILYKQGRPYHTRYEQTRAGYIGALKMTLLEELVHSVQKNLYEFNKAAVIEVNCINEELARTILNINDSDADKLADYLRLPAVPDEFAVAKRANLFFTLNPDNFIVNVLGPDVMTYTKVEVDSQIATLVPSLHQIYQKWLLPIQRHHAAFSTMEGMAEFCVQNILHTDEEYAQYITTFMGGEPSTYQLRKHMGKDFVESIYAKKGKKTFEILISNPPTTHELKNPLLYLKRI